MFPISKSIKFPLITTQLKYCQKVYFEADPINKFETLIIKTIFPISKSIKFPFIPQLNYCQKFDCEADPINEFKTLTIKTISDFKIN